MIAVQGWTQDSSAEECARGVLHLGELWPASIGHGFIIGTSTIPMLPLKGPANLLLGPGPGGVIGMLGYLALVLVLYFSRRAFTGRGEAGSMEAQAAGMAQPG